MSGFMQDVEQDFSGGQGNQDQQQQGDQQQGNQQGGFENDARDLAQDTQGTGNSSGGFMANAERTTEDGFVNQEVNSFLNKEGVPVGADGAVDNVVDGEANKFI